MGRKTRLWIGITLFFIIIINYGIFALPLVERRRFITDKANTISARETKTSKRSDRREGEYMLEIFRKERNALDRKIRNLNGIAVTCAVIILSWTAFGIVVRRKKR